VLADGSVPSVVQTYKCYRDFKWQFQLNKIPLRGLSVRMMTLKRRAKDI
jgi:hypothetical protein